MLMERKAALVHKRKNCFADFLEVFICLLEHRKSFPRLYSATEGFKPSLCVIETNCRLSFIVINKTL